MRINPSYKRSVCITVESCQANRMSQSVFVRTTHRPISPDSRNPEVVRLIPHLRTSQRLIPTRQKFILITFRPNPSTFLFTDTLMQFSSVI